MTVKHPFVLGRLSTELSQVLVFTVFFTESNVILSLHYTKLIES